MLSLDECDDIESGGNDNFDAIQKAINAGYWSMPGSYGRTMMAAIEAGECVLGRTGFRDAYGNYVPSRFEVAAGTKGSFTYVQARIGFEEADRRDKL